MSRQKVLGLGGVFIRAKNAEALRKWYFRHLGLDITGIPLRPQFVYQGRRDVCCDEKFGGRLFGGLEFLLP